MPYRRVINLYLLSLLMLLNAFGHHTQADPVSKSMYKYWLACTNSGSDQGITSCTAYLHAPGATAADHQHALVVRGQIFSWEKHDFKRAIDDFSAAIALSGDHPLNELYSLRGEAYVGAGSYATWRWRTCINHYNCLVIQILIYMREWETLTTIKEKYDQAASEFTEAIRGDPLRWYYHRDRCYANFKRGLYNTALTDCSEAIRLDPTRTELYESQTGDLFLLFLRKSWIATEAEMRRFAIFDGACAGVWVTPSDIYALFPGC